MATLIIRDLDDALLVQLKKRAWHQGLPLEESLRRLMTESVSAESDFTESDTSYNRPFCYDTDASAEARYARLYS